MRKLLLVVLVALLVGCSTPSTGDAENPNTHDVTDNTEETPGDIQQEPDTIIDTTDYTKMSQELTEVLRNHPYYELLFDSKEAEVFASNKSLKIKREDQEFAMNEIMELNKKVISVMHFEDTVEIEYIKGNETKKAILTTSYYSNTHNYERLLHGRLEANNGNDIYNSKSLIEVIEKCKTNKAELTLIRDEKIIKRTVKLYKENEKNKLGLWVRDSTSGVGTLTFYDEKTKKFAALGHPVTDADTNTLYDIKDGDILNASVIGIKKSEKGIPGEHKGIFLDSKKALRQNDKNTECGIFGRYNQNFKVNTERKKIKAGTRDEIEIGKAYIVTTIDETGPCEYEIEILKLFNQNEPNGKSMLIKITDEKLLEKTGGIVQGMSGSPIIQNGKIIGAVTHVLVNKPTMGYGIYIDWMLEEADII